MSRVFIVLLFATLTGLVSALAQEEVKPVRNAALLYYRASWAEPLEIEKREPLRSGKVDAEVEHYFDLSDTQAALALIRAAGKIEDLNWGIEATYDESGLGWLSVLSRAGHILSDLPLDHFYFLAAATTNTLTGDDLIAVFDLAKHLAGERRIPAAALTRGTVISKTIRAAAARMGRIEGRELARLKRYLDEHASVFELRAGDTLMGNIEYSRAQIESFRMANPEIQKGEKLDEFLRTRMGASSNPMVRRQPDAESIFQLIEREFAELEKVAPQFNQSSREGFEEAMSSVDSVVGVGSIGAVWAENNKSIWERYFSTTQRIELFRTGLNLMIEGESGKAKQTLPEGIEFSREENGFKLRARGVVALGRPMELNFGGFVNDEQIPDVE